MSQRLAQAVRRQRGALTELLREAGVPPTDEAYDLVYEALVGRSGLPRKRWDMLADSDTEVLRRVDAACRAYARRRGRLYRGLILVRRSEEPGIPRAARRGRRKVG
jgi:hypothetical protein